MRSPQASPAVSGQVKVMLLALSAGLLGGGVAVLFRALAVSLPQLVWPAHANLVAAVRAAPVAAKIGIPVAGAFLAGGVLWLGTRWTTTARGWDILEAVVLRDGILHLRSALVRCASSLLTIASAGPIGREGSMVLLSASATSLGARRLSLPVRQRRLLVACGVAAGMACAYNAPIGAALFTMEVIVGNFALEIFAPLVFASVVATLLGRYAFSGAPVFELPMFRLVHPLEVVPYLLLGILAGLLAALFLRGLRWSAVLFRKSRLPRPLAMAAAGLMLGSAVLAFPELVGNGREAILDLFSANWVPGFALTLLGLRLFLTSATVGSGAVGGVFTPTLFLGAVLGDAFGSVVHGLAPALTAGPKAYALVGMGCLLAGTTHAPIMAVLMLFEMTLDYNIVLPLLVGCAASSLVARGIDEESIYTEALRRKRGVPGSAGEAGVIRSLTVSDVMRSDQAHVAGDITLPQLLDRFIQVRRNHLYIVDEAGRFLGAVSLYETGRALKERPQPHGVQAVDIADRHFPTTTPDEHLDQALERFWTAECERLPVLDSRKSRRLIGTVSKRDILGVYSLEVLHRRTLLTRFQDGAAPKRASYVQLPEDHQVEEIPVPAGLIGMSFAELRFRERYGLSVLLVERLDPAGKRHRLIPEGATRLEPGDRLVVFGQRERVEGFAAAGRAADGDQP